MSQPIQRLPDARYGESKEFEQQQQAAPVPAGEAAATTPPPPSPVQPDQAAPPEADYFAGLAPVSPLNAPTDRPNEPVTAGSPMGAGSNVLFPNQAPQAFSLSGKLGEYAGSDPTGAVAWLAHQLSEMGQ